MIERRHFSKWSTATGHMGEGWVGRERQITEFQLIKAKLNILKIIIIIKTKQTNLPELNPPHWTLASCVWEPAQTEKFYRKTYPSSVSLMMSQISMFSVQSSLCREPSVAFSVKLERHCFIFLLEQGALAGNGKRLEASPLGLLLSQENIQEQSEPKHQGCLVSRSHI